MMVADREESAGYGPLLDPLWRALLRLTPVPDDHLADPWVGHAWTYEPPGGAARQRGAPHGPHSGSRGPQDMEQVTARRALTKDV